jgi:hypothetical protein
LEVLIKQLAAEGRPLWRAFHLGLEQRVGEPVDGLSGRSVADMRPDKEYQVDCSFSQDIVQQAFA